MKMIDSRIRKLKLDLSDMDEILDAGAPEEDLLKNYIAAEIEFLRDLDALIRRPQEGDMIDILVTSGFGYNTQRPFVQILIHAADWSSQMAPAAARELAHNLLCAAEAAEQDGFFVHFLQQSVGVKDTRAVATILQEFREWRAALQKGAEDGNT